MFTMLQWYILILLPLMSVMSPSGGLTPSVLTVLRPSQGWHSATPAETEGHSAVDPGGEDQWPGFYRTRYELGLLCSEKTPRPRQPESRNTWTSWDKDPLKSCWWSSPLLMPSWDHVQRSLRVKTSTYENCKCSTWITQTCWTLICW